MEDRDAAPIDLAFPDLSFAAMSRRDISSVEKKMEVITSVP
jgi:hypothetical protein